MQDEERFLTNQKLMKIDGVRRKILIDGMFITLILWLEGYMCPAAEGSHAIYKDLESLS